MADETMAPIEPTEERDELVPTSAADWSTSKVAQGIVVELPSGCVARLRKPPLQYLLATGRIPPKLWAKMQKVGVVMFVDPFKYMCKAEIALFIDWMIAEAFIEPRVGVTRAAGTICIKDITEDDKGAVMKVVGLSLMG